MTEKKTPWSDDLAARNALQRIALAAGIVSAAPAEIADFVCAELESPFGRHGFSGLVLHMMRAGDDLAAGAEALGAAISRCLDANAAMEFSDADAGRAVLDELEESESHLTECHERVVRQAQRYGRRANRVRDAISEHHSSAAAQALIALGDRLADADLPTGGGAQ